ncbi:hypothetical protein GCM10010095_16690 [Streptomyces anthocyanicus]|nr:hypothetical protein GCM10010095_16690 [Streptomyces anthocyanicus]
MTDTAAFGHRPTHPTTPTDPGHRRPTAPARSGPPTTAAARLATPRPDTDTSTSAGGPAITAAAPLRHRPTHPTTPTPTDPDHRRPTAPARSGPPTTAAARPTAPRPDTGTGTDTGTGDPAITAATTPRHRPTHPTTPHDPDRARPAAAGRPMGAGPAPEEGA